MTTAPAPGRWRLAGLFLLIALPLMGAAWWVNLHDPREVVMAAAQLVLLLAPALAAAIVGAYWRGRLGYYPLWAQRRPYSRLMAYLLVVVSGLFTLVLIVTAPLAETEYEPGETFGAVLAVIDALMRGEGLALIAGMFVLSIIGQLILGLIQTEIGLFLGAWLADRRLGGPRKAGSDEYQ